MAVPAEDERDWEFATAFDLPIIRTVQPSERHRRTRAYTGDGPTINSANDEVCLNGLSVAEAKATIIDLAGGQGPGRPAPSPTSCATGCSAGSGTGASRSRSSTTSDGLPDRAARVDAAGRAARGRRTTRPRTLDPDDADVRAGAAAGPGRPTGSTSSWTWATGRKTLPPRHRTRCRSGRARAGTTCATWTRRTTSALVDPEIEAYWMGPRPVGARPT